MDAWYALEVELKIAFEEIREGNIRPERALNDAIQNGKKLLEEVRVLCVNRVVTEFRFRCEWGFMTYR